jgi:hypothetical protein
MPSPSRSLPNGVLAPNRAADAMANGAPGQAKRSRCIERLLRAQTIAEVAHAVIGSIRLASTRYPTHSGTVGGVFRFLTRLGDANRSTGRFILTTCLAGSQEYPFGAESVTGVEKECRPA